MMIMIIIMIMTILMTVMTMVIVMVMMVMMEKSQTASSSILINDHHNDHIRGDNFDGAVHAVLIIKMAISMILVIIIMTRIIIDSDGDFKSDEDVKDACSVLKCSTFSTPQSRATKP